MRPIERIHRNRINEAVDTFEDNRRKLRNAEEILNLYYDDTLEKIEQRRRNDPEVKNLQAISFQVEETRQLINALDELSGVALDESLRLKVFLDGSRELRIQLVTSRQPLRQVLRKESVGYLKTPILKRVAKSPIFELEDKAASKRFIKQLTAVGLGTQCPEAIRLYFASLLGTGDDLTISHEIVKKYPERPYLHFEIACLNLYHLSYEIYKWAGHLGTFCKALLKGEIPLSPTTEESKSPSMPSTRTETVGARSRLEQERSSSPATQGRRLGEDSGSHETPIRDKLKLFKKGMMELTAIAEQADRNKQDMEYYKNQGYKIERIDGGKFKPYFEVNGEKVYVDVDDELDEDSDDSPKDQLLSTPGLEVETRKKMEGFLRPLRIFQATELKTLVEYSEEVHQQVQNGLKYADKWPVEKADVEIEKVDRYKSTLNQDLPAVISKKINRAYWYLRKYRDDPHDIQTVERYNHCQNSINVLTSEFSAFGREMIALHFTTEPKYDPVAKAAIKALNEIDCQIIRIIRELPLLPRKFRTGHVPTKKDLEKISREEAQAVVKKHQLVRKEKIKKHDEGAKKRRYHPDVSSFLTTMLPNLNFAAASTPKSASTTAPPASSASKGRPAPDDNEEGQPDDQGNLGAGGGDEPPNRGSGGKKPPDDKVVDDEEDEDEDKKKKKGKKKKSKGKRESDDEKEKDRRQLLNCIRRGRYHRPDDPDEPDDPDDPSDHGEDSVSSSSESVIEKDHYHRKKKKKQQARDRMKRDKDEMYMTFNYARAGIQSDDTDPFQSLSEDTIQSVRRELTREEKLRKRAVKKQRQEIMIRRLEAVERQRKNEDRSLQDSLYHLGKTLKEIGLDDHQVATHMVEVVARRAGEPPTRRDYTRENDQFTPGSKDIKPSDAIPPFDATDNGLAVKRFLKEVDMVKAHRNWSDSYTAEQVRMKLGGKAKTWLMNHSKKEWSNRYSGIRHELLKRFYSGVRLSEKIQIRQNLTFSPNKHSNHQDFYDEIASKEDILFDSGELDIDWSKTHTLEECKNEQFLQIFLLGAAPGVRQKTLEHKCETLKQCLEVAKTYEEALKGRDFRDRRNPGSSYVVDGIEYPIDGFTDMHPSFGYVDEVSAQISAVKDEGCYYCGESGHLKRECPKYLADRASGSLHPDRGGKYAGVMARNPSVMAGSGPPRNAPFGKAVSAYSKGSTTRSSYRLASGSSAPRGRLQRRRGGGRRLLRPRTGRRPQVAMVEGGEELDDDGHPEEIYLEEENEVIYEDEAGKTFTIGENNEITEVTLPEGPEEQLQVSSISEDSKRTSLHTTSVEEGASAREYCSRVFQLI